MQRRTMLVIATAILATSQVASAKHVKIWLKAFIPNTGLQIVQPVPGAQGHTMIPGPRIMALAVDKSCYNTNDRGFSHSSASDAKITIVTEFDVLAPGIANIVKIAPQIGTTTRYVCATGDVVGRKSASSQDLELGQPTYDAGVVSFAVDAEASNPFIPLPPSISPSIKIHGIFTVDTNARKARFTGTVAKFPSYEAYISLDGGAPVVVFQVSPAADASPWSLVFSVAVDKTTSF